MVSSIYYAAFIAVLFNSVKGHIKMAQPVPFSADKVDTSPIKAADFPCKQTLGYEISQMNEMEVGSTQSITFDGTAVHGGGSCQLAVTLDKEPTADSKFKVIHSIMGGCPGVDGSTGSFDFTLPADLPNGEATFAWTWFARLSGQPEMYMNCAPITLTGGADDSSAFDQLPDLFVANLETSQCKSPESKDLLFPDPGQSVVESPGATLEAPTGSDCGAGGTGSSPGGGGEEIGNPDNGSPNTGDPNAGAPNPVAPGNGDSGAGEKNPGIPDPDASNPGIPSPSAPDGSTPDTGSPNDGSDDIEIVPIRPSLANPPAQSDINGAPQVSAKPEPTSSNLPTGISPGPVSSTAALPGSSAPASSAVQLPVQSSASAIPSTLLTITTSSPVANQPTQKPPTEVTPVTPPVPSSSTGTGIGNDGSSGTGSGSSSGACTENGTMLCNGASQFGLCDNGKITWQAVAPGTSCQDGTLMKM